MIFGITVVCWSPPSHLPSNLNLWYFDIVTPDLWTKNQKPWSQPVELVTHLLCKHAVLFFSTGRATSRCWVRNTTSTNRFRQTSDPFEPKSEKKIRLFSVTDIFQDLRLVSTVAQPTELHECCYFPGSTACQYRRSTYWATRVLQKISRT